jgi:exonuclease III
MMRLVSWNGNRAGRHVEKQVAALLEQKTDILALQEVSGESIDRYIHDFETPPNRLSDHAMVEMVFEGV